MAGNGWSGSYLTPEAQASIEIDRQLEAAGWVVQDYRAINLAATASGGKVAGVAVREFPLAAGHGVADYLLFVDRQAVGVLEAKRVGTSLIGSRPSQASTSPACRTFWSRRSGRCRSPTSPPAPRPGSPTVSTQCPGPVRSTGSTVRRPCRAGSRGAPGRPRRRCSGPGCGRTRLRSTAVRAGCRCGVDPRRAQSGRCTYPCRRSTRSEASSPRSPHDRFGLLA